MQIVDGEPRPVAIKEGKGSSGILARDAKIIRALLPIRDAVREVLRAQAADQPWARGAGPAAHRLRSFVRGFGPINHTVVSVTTDAETGEERETHRRPNLAPFADDPDCWLVASIEDYDLESGLARMGPIFRERVIAPPAAPLIATAADALAVTLNETGRVDLDHLAELLDRDPETALAQLGEAVFRNPAHGSLGDRRRLSLGLRPHQAGDRRGRGRARSAVCAQRRGAAARAARGPAAVGHHRAARRAVDSGRRHRGVRRRGDGHRDDGAPHRRDRLLVGGRRAVRLAPPPAPPNGAPSRRNAGWLLHDALNSATPQIFDTVVEDGVEKRVLNSEATEAAKEKLAKIKEAFTAWVWTDPDRTDRLARALQRPLQQSGAAPLRRAAPDPARRQQHHPPLRPPEAGDLAHRRIRLDLHRPHGRRREILRHRRRHHGAEAARPDQQGHAGGARPLPRAGVARVPAALPDRPHPGRRRDQLREGEALAVPRPRGDGELGRGDHHPCGLPLHPGAGRLRARDDRGADRRLRRHRACAPTTTTASPASASRR